jgi:MSHA biogenesis protein MshK
VYALVVGDEENETGHVGQVIASCVAAVLICALAQADARAQPMNDPMRPPGESASGMPGAAAAAGTGLQAVITSPGRKLALIDGSVVPLGAPVRDATLAGVSDSLAVLKKNGERDVLLMHPNIDKKRRAP